VLAAWEEALLGVAICLALLSAGIAVLRALLLRVAFLDLLALGFPLGAGLFTWLLFLMSWAGIRLSLLSAAITCCLLIATALVVRAVRPCDPQAAVVGERSDHRPTDTTPRDLAIVSIILVGATACAAWLGVSRSYSGWDDMAIWAVKGYAIAREGSIWAAGSWGDHGLSYPLNLPLLIAVFRFGGDALPASKLIFPFFYLSACAGCLRFWLQRGVAPRTAMLGAVCLASTPILFEHAALGYANLPYTAYLVLGIAEGTQGIAARDTRRQVLSGLLLGMAAWTRPEGILVIASVMFVMGVLAWRIRPRALRLVPWALPAVLAAGVWSVFTRFHASGGQMQQAVEAALQAMGQGEFHLGALYYIVRFMGRQAFEVSVWGLLPFVCLGLLALGARKIGPRSNPDAFLVAAALAVVAAGSTSHYYLADFIGILARGMANSANRMYMPVAVLAALLALLLTRGPMSGAVAPGGLGGYVGKPPAEVERDA